MLKVALTGGIATGKSYVLARLKDRGVPTIDADDIVHEALGPGTPTASAIATQFGREFLRPDGSIDRMLLAGRVFGDRETRRQLEAIVHPLVYDAIRNWFETLDRPVGMASIPLLYETRREHDFDVVVVTVCPPGMQLQRLRDRGMSDEEAHQRIAAQMPADEKASRGSFVIRTGGTMAETDRQVEELLIALNGIKKGL
jgi:dephospho-CoA kinase